MKTILLTILTVFLCSVNFANDILTLNNEMVFQGKVKQINACSILFKSDGKKFDIPSEDIFSVKFDNPKDKIYTSYMEMAERNPKACMQGTLDADNLHGRSGSYFTMGMLFGPFALIGAAMGNPSPISSKNAYYMSGNQDLFQDPMYLNCYKRKAKSKNVKSAAAGWGAWILVVLLSAV
ncbi:MAG: hypothetical protein AAF587_34685 [Bacteroidota bacterium]